MNKDLNTLRDQAYECACKHGFHNKEYSDEHLLCLVISELMEAAIFGLANYLKIDLLWHIEKKMKYNELRPMLHGKRY